MEANDRITYMAPEVRCLERIHEKGYTDQFQLGDTLLICLDNQAHYRPEQVSVVNFYRFEGVSDPDDMSIIYVIETNDGHRGTLIDAYGVYADDTVTAFMNQVNFFSKQTIRGWE